MLLFTLTRSVKQEARERVLFIGTQFSILYTLHINGDFRMSGKQSTDVVGVLGNRRVSASHGIFCRVPVCCVADLQDVEAQLRRLYGTADGQVCQALSTIEFQDWKRSVSCELRDAPCASPSASIPDNCLRRRVLQQHTGAPPALVAGDQTPRQLLRTIEAFLPAQYHLLYACQSVDIDRIMPLLPTPRAEKREREGCG